jgi:hypothetical protein
MLAVTEGLAMQGLHGLLWRFDAKEEVGTFALGLFSG